MEMSRQRVYKTVRRTRKQTERIKDHTHVVVIERENRQRRERDIKKDNNATIK